MSSGPRVSTTKNSLHARRSTDVGLRHSRFPHVVVLSGRFDALLGVDALGPGCPNESLADQILQRPLH